MQVRWGVTEGFGKGNRGLHLTGPSSVEHRLKEATKTGEDQISQLRDDGFDQDLFV